MACDNCGDCNDTCEPFFGQIRDAINSAFAAEKRNIAAHVPHGQFTLEYTSGCDVGAYSSAMLEKVFVTKGLRCKLYQASRMLAGSDDVAQVLRNASAHNVLAGVLIIQMAFTALHEWSHVVLGHSGEPAGLMAHVYELDADGYATRHAMHYVMATARANTASQLNCAHEPEREKDAAIFALLVMALGGMFFAFKPRHNFADILSDEHPPHAARMHFITRNAIQWCRDNRPEAESALSAARWKELMHHTASAVWGLNGGVDWSDQITFLRSHVGKQYMSELEAAWLAYRRSR